MNALKAKIEAIESDDFFTIVSLHSNGITLKLLKTELPGWIAIGDTVECHIQEASVSVCKGDKEGDVSIENRIEGSVSHMLTGDVLSQLTLNTPCGEIKSLVTTDACKRMKINHGERVMLLLKAVDINVSPWLHNPLA